MKIYELGEYRLVRKKAGLASSFGDSRSIFNELEGSDFFKNQKKVFAAAQERGLCNRLDVVTSGLVVFAKTQDAYTRRGELQKQGRIQKTYIADLAGRRSLRHLGYFRRVKQPIGHHEHLEDRMVLDRHGQAADSFFEYLRYDSITDTTTVRVTITKGVRHQIRLHAKYLALPIVGDRLYGYRGTETEVTAAGGIHLRSVGLEIEE